MNDKACILLDIVDGKTAQVVQFLQGSLGVFIADAVEGPPDVIIVMEVPNREQLAKLTNQAIASVETMTELTNQAIASLETMTEHIHLIPARKKINTATSSKISRRSKGSDKKGSSKRLLSQ